MKRVATRRVQAQVMQEHPRRDRPYHKAIGRPVRLCGLPVKTGAAIAVTVLIALPVPATLGIDSNPTLQIGQLHLSFLWRDVWASVTLALIGFAILIT